MRNTLQVPNDGLPLGSWPELSIVPVQFIDLRLSDVVFIVDSVGRVCLFSRSVVDPISLAGAFSSLSVVSRDLSDSLIIGESVNQSLILARSLSDVISFEDIIYPVTAFHRPIVDAVSLDDSIDRMLVFLKFLSDSITIGESVLSSRILLLYLQELLELFSSVNRRKPPKPPIMFPKFYSSVIRRRGDGVYPLGGGPIRGPMFGHGSIRENDPWKNL